MDSPMFSVMQVAERLGTCKHRSPAAKALHQTIRESKAFQVRENQGLFLSQIRCGRKLSNLCRIAKRR